MGEYAELALERAARTMYDPKYPRPLGRNEKVARCPYCQKGIRHIRGEIRGSMAMHIKAKHPEQFNAAE